MILETCERLPAGRQATARARGIFEHKNIRALKSRWLMLGHLLYRVGLFAVWGFENNVVAFFLAHERGAKR